eukprot:GHVU01212357.1.p1 GENE.GHVU01212357.1~~GHVU01212357.1.p1  ORF type:complete len:182 (+),score=2.26 GHVU01212357.1:65-610(+)
MRGYSIVAFLGMCTALIPSVSAQLNDSYADNDIDHVVDHAAYDGLAYEAPDSIWDPFSDSKGPINGTDPASKEADLLPYTFNVKIRSNCNSAMRVAVHFKRYYNSYNIYWTTVGYWNLYPGQTKLTNVRTKNRYIYFHAHSFDNKWWWQGPYKWWVFNKLRSFFISDMGPWITTFTQTFSC